MSQFHPSAFLTEFIHSRIISTPWGAYTPINATTIISNITEYKKCPWIGTLGTKAISELKQWS